MKVRYKTSRDDMIYNILSKLILFFVLVTTIYPIYFVLVASFTNPQYVNRGDLLLYPKGFNIAGYKKVFQDERVWIGYTNTILYTVCGTLLGTMATLMAGFAISRKQLPGHSIFIKIMIFTMYFSGGMIPFYLVIQQFGLLNTRLILILLGSVSAFNIIIVKSFMESSIPEELFEAAKIDGCGIGKYFFRIVLPLSKAVTAVIALYISVSYWNAYFNAMILITDSKKYPLQLFLREILLTVSVSSNSSSAMSDPEAMEKMDTLVQLIKYAMIVVTTLPIVCVYPFIQKYFVKGVMIGSVKG